MSIAITRSGVSLILTDSNGPIKNLPSPFFEYKAGVEPGTFDTIIFRSGEQLEAVNLARISTIGGVAKGGTPALIIGQLNTLLDFTSGGAPAIPVGAATADKQDIGNGSLTLLLSSIGGPGSVEATDDTGVWALMSLIKRSLLNWTNLFAIIPLRKTGGGHLLLQTDVAGTGFIAFGSQACTQLTIVNDTGVTIEVEQGGSGVALPVLNGTHFPFQGITNANQLSVRRFDQNVVQVDVKARWEA